MILVEFIYCNRIFSSSNSPMDIPIFFLFIIFVENIEWKLSDRNTVLIIKNSQTSNFYAFGCQSSIFVYRLQFVNNMRKIVNNA